MCTSVAEADDLLRIAHDRALKIGVNHNFLFAPAYERLRKIVHSGEIGLLDHVAVNHFFELPQFTFGPLSTRGCCVPLGDVILEVGPHLLSAVLDLVGKPEHLSVTADRQLVLPGRTRICRRWRIHTIVGRTAVDININLSPGFAQRTIIVRGQNGTAALDFDANTCVIDRRTLWSFDLDRYSRSRSTSRQIRSQARSTLSTYLLSTVKLCNRGGPYQATFLDSVASFYRSLAANEGPEGRIDGGTGRDVIDWCNKIIESAGVAPEAPSRRHSEKHSFASRPCLFLAELDLSVAS